jgi:hypothetical protein
LGFTSEGGGEVASNKVGLPIKVIFEMLPTEFGPPKNERLYGGKK